jgi:hypothetical protein
VPRKKKLTRTITRSPKSQVVRDAGAGKLSKEDWGIVASDAWQSIISAIGTRSALEANLRTAYALYERDNRDEGVEDDPYVDSSDLTIPLVFSKLRKQKTEVASLTFVPDFYLFTGQDESSQAQASDMQVRWNSDFHRLRGPYMSWQKAHDKMLHMALRDGTAFMECSWVKDDRMQRYKVESPVTDETGMPTVDEESGEISTKPEYVTMPVTVYDDGVLNPCLLKDVLLMPNESTSVETAAAVAIYHLYYESDLRAMIEDDILDEEWVNRALEYDLQGYSDYASRFQGVYNWTAGGQIDVGVGQGQGIAAKEFVNRGPLGCWVVYSRQYDFDGDKIEEPNILFIHEVSGFMIGHCPDTDMAPMRLIVAFAPYPRPDSPYGFGVPELIGPFQAEATLSWNQRNDAVSTRLEVPLLTDTSIQIKDSGMSWGNGRVWWVLGNAQQGSLQNVLYYPQLPEVPLSSYQQDQQVRSDADSVLGGSSQPATSRESAAGVKTRAGESDLGTNDIAMELRYVSHQIFDALWSLRLQYGFNLDGTERNPPQGAKPLTKQMMQLPYKRSVSGEDDPLDKQAQLEEMLGFKKTFEDSPFIQGNLMHRYNFERAIASKFGIGGLDGIFGTPDDVTKMQQEQEKQGQEKSAIEKQQAYGEIATRYNRGRPQAGMSLLGPDDIAKLFEPPPGQQQPGQPGKNGQPSQNVAPQPAAAGAG